MWTQFGDAWWEGSRRFNVESESNWGIDLMINDKSRIISVNAMPQHKSRTHLTSWKFILHYNFQNHILYYHTKTFSIRWVSHSLIQIHVAKILIISITRNLGIRFCATIIQTSKKLQKQVFFSFFLV